MNEHVHHTRILLKKKNSKQTHTDTHIDTNGFKLNGAESINIRIQLMLLDTNDIAWKTKKMIFCALGTCCKDKTSTDYARCKIVGHYYYYCLCSIGFQLENRCNAK